MSLDAFVEILCKGNDYTSLLDLSAIDCCAGNTIHRCQTKKRKTCVSLTQIVFVAITQTLHFVFVMEKMHKIYTKL